VYRKLRAMQAADLVREGGLEDRAAAPPPATPEAADAQLTDQLSTAAMAMALGFLSMRQSEALEQAKDPDHSPESNVGHAELIDRLRQAIDERPEQERLLLTRHYFDDVTLEEAGAEMGLSKSWASRLHARAIEAVARAMKRERVEG